MLFSGFILSLVKRATQKAQRRRCSQVVCPFWATVVAQHGGSVEVDLLLCRYKELILSLQKQLQCTSLPVYNVSIKEKFKRQSIISC